MHPHRPFCVSPRVLRDFRPRRGFSPASWTVRAQCQTIPFPLSNPDRTTETLEVSGLTWAAQLTKIGRQRAFAGQQRESSRLSFSTIDLRGPNGPDQQNCHELLETEGFPCSTKSRRSSPRHRRPIRCFNSDLLRRQWIVPANSWS